MKFLNFFARVSKAKEMPGLTTFLVTNPFFRRFVLAFHQEKTETISSVDKYLERQLLSKEEYDAIYNAKRLEKKHQGSSQDRNKPTRQ